MFTANVGALTVVPSRVTPSPLDVPGIAWASGASVAWGVGLRRRGRDSVLGSLHPLTTVIPAQLVLHERLGTARSAGVPATLTGVALVAVQ